MKKKIIFLLLILILLITCSGKKKDIPYDYFPENEWRISTPEEQGIDSEYLLNMIKEIKNTKDGIHSILVIRNGHLILDSYFYPFTKDELHPVYSCTKSVTSALTGIAIDQGKIKNVNEKVLDYFPEYKDKLENYDKRKNDITLKHLLTMTSGLEWNDSGDVMKLLHSPDWTKYILDKPIASTPGETNNYNSANSYLLSVIIKKAVNESFIDYSKNNLFNILNIKDFAWKQSPQGAEIGGWGLYLKPADMAKFGYLYLKEGNWNGKQVITKKWIKESLKKHSEWTGWGEKMDYGYSWWLIKGLPFKCYEANGIHGQHIIVIPKLDMVVVFTSENEKTPYKYFIEYILNAVKSNKPLEENNRINKELTQLLNEIIKPVITDSKELPDIAKKISGKTYEVSGKNIDINRLTLNFNSNNNYTASIITSTNGNNITEYLIGMDGQYRKTQILLNNNKINYFAKGYWKDQNTFILETYLGDAYRNKLTILLKDKNINIVINNVFGNYFLLGKIID